ncbi:MAG TPA: LemA family protein [Candidatus Angelobacter sp.]
MDISIVLISISVVAAILLFLLLKTYNGLVKMRNAVQSGWADIDVQLMRRHDLVPNLVEAVKGYMTHERATLEAVTRARTEAVAATSGTPLAVRAATEMRLTGAVSNLFVSAERYPALKASQQFLLLQEQITSTENRIAFARQHYNECVRKYNTAQAEFPRNLIAGPMGFTPAALFAADAGDKANVGVKV